MRALAMPTQQHLSEAPLPIGDSTMHLLQASCLLLQETEEIKMINTWRVKYMCVNRFQTII